jgi:hypothetical protein
LLKGFTMDDERLKNPPVADSVAPDYFAQMLERVRDIRAGERRMYLRVREIFALAEDVAKTNLAAILNQHGLANVRSL